MAAVGSGGRIYYDLEMSPGTDATLTELSERLGLSKTDVIRFGLGLVKLLSDAREEDKSLAVVTRDGKVEMEVMGP
jgi:hypothetical protein